MNRLTKTNRLPNASYVFKVSVLLLLPHISAQYSVIKSFDAFRKIVLMNVFF